MDNYLGFKVSYKLLNKLYMIILWRYLETNILDFIK